MSERVEAAAKAEFNSIWRGCSWDGPVNPTTEETREKFREATAAGLAASDAVMFSEEAIERAAEALEASGILPSNGNDQQDRNAATGIVRAVVAALRGEA